MIRGGKMQSLKSTLSHLEVVTKIADRIFEGKGAIGFCGICRKERSYTQEQVIKMMNGKMPRCNATPQCNNRPIDLRAEVG